MNRRIAIAAALAAMVSGVKAFEVGEASSMESVRPKIPRRIESAQSFSVRLARGEYESFQLLVRSDSDMKGLRVEAFGGEAADWVECSPVGYVKLVNKPEYFDKLEGNPTLGWWPNLILDFLDSADVPAGDVMSFWIRVHCPRETAAGEYGAVLRVSADGEEAREFPLAVRVNGFEMPAVAPLPMAVTFSPGSHQILPGHYSNPLKSELDAMKERNEDPDGPVKLWERHRAEWGDFLADYFITPDSLYLDGENPPHFDMLERVRDQGRINRFNLNYWSYPKSLSDEDVQSWRERVVGQSRKAYERAKELGIADRAYLYGCDETTEEKFPLIAKAIEILKEEFPGVPLLTTALDNSYGAGSALAGIDAFCPRTDHYDAVRAGDARSRGKKVWWYICCYPLPPYANMFIESRPIEGRLLMGAMSVKYRPDGFLYYETSVWNSRRPVTSGPYTDWEPRSWSLFSNGDGAWTAAGPDGIPVATQRLENFRDGIEDFAYAKIYEEKFGVLPEVSQELVGSLVEYSVDPAVLRAWRDSVADAIESGGSVTAK